MLNFLTLQPEPHILLVHHSIFCGLISGSRLEWKSLESKPAPGVFLFRYSAKASDGSPRSLLSRSQGARVSPFQLRMPRGHGNPPFPPWWTRGPERGPQNRKIPRALARITLRTFQLQMFTFLLRRCFWAATSCSTLLQVKSPALRRGPGNTWALL